MKGHRWFAATYDLVTRWSESKLLRHLRPHIAGQATGRVLEVGAGTGANFAHYQCARGITATEPDPFMLRRSQKRVQKLRLDIALCQAAAEALPFADASFDTVVVTLALCTVTDPARSLAEMKRVLKPHGTLRFIEHVRADGRLGRVQDVLAPAWRWFGAGCHLNRRTAENIAAAGFENIELQERRLLLMPLIVGVARTASSATRPRGRRVGP